MRRKYLNLVQDDRHGDCEKLEVKLQAHPFHAMQAYRGSKGIAPLTLNLGTGWRRVVNVRPQPLYPRERAPLSTEQVAVWAPEKVWTSWRREKVSCP